MLRRNLSANFLGQGWSALMGLAFVPLYIKYLGIEAYGLIGLFAVLTAWLSLLDAGMIPTLGREMARFTGGGHSNQSIRDLLRSVEVIIIGIALLVAGSVSLCSNWIASSWLQAEALPVDVVAQAFVIMGLVTAIRFVEGVYRSVIVGLQRQVLFNAVNSVMATFRGLGAVAILVWWSPTIQAFFLWQGAVSIATLGILAMITYASLPRAERSGRFSIKALQHVWGFARGMLGLTLLGLLLGQVDKVLLSRLLSLAEYGYYTFAAVIAGALQFMLISPITQAVYPRLCEQRESGDQLLLVRTFHSAAQMVSVVAGSAAIVLFVFTETFLQLWARDAELALRVAPLLSILVLGNLCNGLIMMPYYAQLAYGRTALVTRLHAVSVAIFIPVILWVTPRYGAEGAAWVWLSLNAGYVLIGVHFMFRRILPEEKWRWYAADIMSPLAPALVGALIVHRLWPDPDGNLQQLLLLLAASACTFLAAVMGAGRIRTQLVRYLQPLLFRHA